MTRLAGENPGYTFRLCRAETGDDGTSFYTPTDHGFDLRSVTTIIKNVMGIPAGAMAWHGFRMGLAGAVGLGPDVLGLVNDAEELESLVRESGIDPNKMLEQAGHRGTAAHNVLEDLTKGDREKAEKAVAWEIKIEGTYYAQAVLSWWDDCDFEAEESLISDIVSERPLWNLRLGYAGTGDLALRHVDGWEICDLKTHKPARGFTKPGKGPGYLSDLLQIRAYRSAWEEMGLGDTIGSRVIIARENGKYLEDFRQVSHEAWLQVLEMDRFIQAFEGGE